MSERGSLGTRMKRYEAATQAHLIRRLPVIVRVDGRAFYTLTRGLPAFDRSFIDRMVTAASATLEEMQGGVLGYVQSDEASFLLTDWANLDTEPWYGYDLQKVVSLAAAEMTTHWNSEPRVGGRPGRFDARAFNLPVGEVANYFLWRAKDWRRNSIQMAAQARFSPRELHGKCLEEAQEMLRAAGAPWEELGDQERRGTWLTQGRQAWTYVEPNYAAVAALVGPLLVSREDRQPGADWTYCGAAGPVAEEAALEIAVRKGERTWTEPLAAWSIRSDSAAGEVYAWRVSAAPPPPPPPEGAEETARRKR